VKVVRGEERRMRTFVGMLPDGGIALRETMRPYVCLVAVYDEERKRWVAIRWSSKFLGGLRWVREHRKRSREAVLVIVYEV